MAKLFAFQFRKIDGEYAGPYGGVYETAMVLGATETEARRDLQEIFDAWCVKAKEADFYLEHSEPVP